MVVATHEDFAVMQGAKLLGGARWEDVRQVRAFKRDELTTDLVCVELEVANESYLLVHEEMPGWDEFLEVAEVALPYMRPRREWEPHVVAEPFAAAEQVLFQRA